MVAYRSIYLVAAAVLIALSACQATERSSTAEATPAASIVSEASPAARVSPPASVAPAASAGAFVPPSDEWTTYRSEASGFQVEHPANYTAQEGVNDQGEATVTFTPPGRGAVITITEQSSIDARAAASDVTGCQDVTINDLPARRCINPTNLTFTTFVESGDAVYNLSAPGRGLRLDVYDRLTSSFKVGS